MRVVFAIGEKKGGGEPRLENPPMRSVPVRQPMRECSLSDPCIFARSFAAFDGCLTQFSRFLSARRRRKLFLLLLYSYRFVPNRDERKPTWGRVARNTVL
jgi:hypothetical protein